MKKALILLSVVLMVMVLASCGDLLAGLTGNTKIQARLTSFVGKINDQDWANIYQDMHPDALNYDQSKASDYWSALFTNSDYSIPFIPPVEGSDDTMKVMTTTIVYSVSGSTFTDPIYITFMESDSDWYIRLIVWDDDNDATEDNIFLNIQ